MSPIKVSASSLFALCLSCSGGTAAEVIAVDHNLLAGGATWQTRPQLGGDASGAILVYTEQPLLPLPLGGWELGSGDTVMQRLTGTQPAGAATVISSSLTNDLVPPFPAAASFTHHLMVPVVRSCCTTPAPARLLRFPAGLK